MNRTTIKQLQELVQTINKITGSPLEPWSREGKFLPNAGCYHLAEERGYVGLQRMCEGGGTSMIFDTATKAVLAGKLRAFISGYTIADIVGI